MKKMVYRWLVCALMAALFMSIMPAAQAAGSFTSQTYNSRTYKIYVPGGYQKGTAVPMIVMMHGCTQDPDQFAAGTQMNTLAESKNFIVIYPDQPSSANQNKCWNWYDPAHQSRGSGEPALIADMVNQVKSQYSIDSNRVYVAGLSAGAAMSVILGVTYPDIFAAINVSSGLEYKSATTLTAANTAMINGGPDPVSQGNAAYSAMGSNKRIVPVIVFHGTSDYIVYPVNGNQVITQWAQTNDMASDGIDNNNITDQPDSTQNGTVSGGRSYTVYNYKDSTTGNIVMQKYAVTSMGHAWSGGSSSGSYTDPQGPNASQLSYDFFMAHPMNGTGGGNGGGGGDTTPPVTSASPAGSTFNAPVTVTLSANESATTYYTLDGSTPTTSSTIYSGPITINASATLKYFSVDTAGNVETIRSQTYTINSAGNSSTLASIAAEDGFAGQLLADGLSTTVHKIGDKGMTNVDTYRTILSFDTSLLPSTATISSVKLRIYRKSLSGTVNSISLDIKNGFFGSVSGLEQGDYGAAASATGIATIAVPASNNAYTEVSLPSSAFTYINKTGRTQLRLKASTPADITSDVLEIYGGEDSTYAPQLIVNY
ncbi:extracellular catalytic domain type 1 short-chain-length polyhydroxyalkanoate depolymerase [Paenibacillus planticolens]|uniref:PHB depolymerase family esterase n=1 Tax=Paenibacillus planticolens TaxID=2654976 RepID=A0ABX1ZM85_9BACL|nr:PHB depolymerase family esterase [Paenibacillus planticolens]NOV01186.1 PHB depolymerase family esterase [Paenibacillus planticolens]